MFNASCRQALLLVAKLLRPCRAAAVLLPVAYVILLAPLSLHAQGSETEVDVLRQQNYTDDGPDLRAVHGWWVSPTSKPICPNAYVEFPVTMYEEDPSTANNPDDISFVEFGVNQTFDSLGQPISRVYAYCHSCSTDNMMNIRHYNYPIHFWMWHDSNGWTWYMSEGGGPWEAIRNVSDAEAGMTAAKHLRVGGQASTKLTHMSYFLHHNLWIRRFSVSHFIKFTPTNTAAILEHYNAFYTDYFGTIENELGSRVGAFTFFNTNPCP